MARVKIHGFGALVRALRPLQPWSSLPAALQLCGWHHTAGGQSNQGLVAMGRVGLRHAWIMRNGDMIQITAADLLSHKKRF